jgi:hypothetical protein
MRSLRSEEAFAAINGSFFFGFFFVANPKCTDRRRRSQLLLAPPHILWAIGYATLVGTEGRNGIETSCSTTLNAITQPLVNTHA